MKYRGPMLLVKDMERTKAFYTSVLGVRVISDLGVNVTITGGMSFQTEESWAAFTGCDRSDLRYQGNAAEFYFEDEDFDGFVQRLKELGIASLEGVITMPYGQKIIRFYDPDQHIVEVGEEMGCMVKRLHKEGLSVDEIVEKTYMKKGMVERLLKK